jgi:PTS system mannose-specific IID component
MSNVAYNIRGLQNIGITFSMLPGLREIYPDPRDFAASCRRYALFHNCHPFWGPFLTGAFLNAELGIAEGRHAPEFLKYIKSTTLNSLSAIGDSFFSGSMDVAFCLLFALLCAHNYLAWACYGLLFWLLSALAVKAATFYIGLRRGLGAVSWLKYFHLINLGDYIKIFCAFVLLALLVHSLRAHSILSAEGVDLAGLLRHWVFPVTILAVFSHLCIHLRHARILFLSILLVLLLLFNVFHDNGVHNWVVF